MAGRGIRARDDGLPSEAWAVGPGRALISGHRHIHTAPKRPADGTGRHGTDVRPGAAGYSPATACWSSTIIRIFTIPK
jgi:hypothetical protein